MREGFCLDGKWDGMVREFDEDRVIKVFRTQFVILRPCPVCRKV